MKIDVRNYVYDNMTEYTGDSSFLAGPTEKTNTLWAKCMELLKKEREKNGLLDVDFETISTVSSHKPGYINQELEEIVGLQTDAPLKRSIKPFGGVRVVEGALNEKGYELPERVKDIFNYAQNHNDAVFSVYDAESRLYRSNHIITGLPDNYARGRIIGDYRRLALYGADALIEAKKEDYENISDPLDDDKIRLREEITKQVQALNEIKKMASSYGFDVSLPATNAKEAVQWVYFAYLSAIKEQDGAAMSLGNVSSFLDIYIEKDLKDGIINEEKAQEYIDHFVMKLRLVRHLRPGAYDDIFGGDPTWVTESIGGMWKDGKTKVTKTSFRFLNTLYNLGPSPEPNLTVLWSENLPEGFKEFCAKVSIDTSSVQYENDDVMVPCRGSDDYGIACCVSYQEIGKRIQHFGARCNGPKALLLAINEGKEESHGKKILTNIGALSDDKLNYDEVYENFKKSLTEVARVYAKTMYCIHYMHDKYYYERAQMAYVDSNYGVDIAYGIAGIAIIADSLSAIKYANVKTIRDENGIAKEFVVEGEYPKYGNDDDRVDNIANEVTEYFYKELLKHKAYKNATPTLSLLTITSNVMYGSNTGATPDGRKAGEAFAPGANPMHGRDHNGAVASLNSVAKLNYENAQDGISNTFSIVPTALGMDESERVDNLVGLMQGYFKKRAHHLNVNVMNREMLIDAYNNPEKYPQLTIRVSGYAVIFNRLSKAHQKEVIERTFHEKM
ncbi:MAG: formate C-acetyltransferase [Candidatus Gracilibacteria bacterium]|nr:formate C-acetyltransferase [Candidatus Gracilibacteria bacterium]